MPLSLFTLLFMFEILTATHAMHNVVTNSFKRSSELGAKCSVVTHLELQYTSCRAASCVKTQYPFFLHPLQHKSTANPLSIPSVSLIIFLSPYAPCPAPIGQFRVGLTDTRLLGGFLLPYETVDDLYCQLILILTY